MFGFREKMFRILQIQIKQTADNSWETPSSVSSSPATVHFIYVFIEVLDPREISAQRSIQQLPRIQQFADQRHH